MSSPTSFLHRGFQSLLRPFSFYADWLHTQWPSGKVEKLPELRADGSCSLPGVYVVGDLTGIPLLKFAADSGAKAIETIVADTSWQRTTPTDSVVDLAIIGCGVSGLSAALQAKKHGLRFVIFEANAPLSTLSNFPKAKPIFTFPPEMRPAGQLPLEATTKESLIAQLEAQRLASGIEITPMRVQSLRRDKGLLQVVHDAQHPPTLARRVIVAIGRSGNYRPLNIPGEHASHVFNRLHDPKDFAGQSILVIGGGDSAVETAIALTQAGARVTLACRAPDFSRAKPLNCQKLVELTNHSSVKNPIQVMTKCTVSEILTDQVRLRDQDGRQVILPNQAVFSMIGREAPLSFFRRSGIALRGEWQASTWACFLLFFIFCILMYLWKGNTTLNIAFQDHHWFPYNLPEFFSALTGDWADTLANPASLLGTLGISLADPGFYYSLAYSLCVLIFGLRRIARRPTPYITLQTTTLIAVQVGPLFLLPFILLPWMGHNGLFDHGLGQTLADQLFPATGGLHGREYWRAFGLILAWPLFIWNVFTSQPLWTWLAISLVQTFVLLPLIVWKWGKGAYCGWLCSCGALAETLGDAHRTKMPHGPFWNRLNLLGQVVLAVVLLLLMTRILGWIWPGSGFEHFHEGLLHAWSLGGVPATYYFWVDTFLAGIVGVGLYFWFSGRVWCRFACPLAALMNIYARFSRFRIFPEKSQCISCNVCTTVCHQGIDVMNFANKGLPMQDPQCVRCSACVSECPTQVLTFGEQLPDGRRKLDKLRAR